MLLLLQFFFFSDGFHQEEKPLNKTKKNGFHQLENPFLLARIKDFVEIDISSRRKKIPLSLNYISNSSKIAPTKKIMFLQAENSFALARVKDFVEQYFSARRKKKYDWQESLKNGEVLISTSQKISRPFAEIIFPQEDFF